MLQQVNLYQPDKNIKREPFSALLMLIVTIVSIMIMFSFYGLLLWKQETLNTEMMAQKAQYQKNLQAVEKLEILVKKLTNTDKEKAQLHSLNTLLKNKQNNLEELGSLVKGNGDGLSAYFLALARKNIEVIWFTEIKVTRGGQKLLLKGKTKAARHIPPFIERLKEEAVFSGISFRLFNAQLNEKDGLVHFILQTELELPIDSL